MKKLSNLLNDTESLIIFSVVIFITFVIASIANRYIFKNLIYKNKEAGSDVTSLIFLKNITIFTIYLLGIGWGLLSLPITKNFAHSLFAGAGVTTLIVGFASQQVLSNMINGVFIIINKPFKINDTIEIQGNIGKVIEITWHDTIIENENSVRIIIPNSIISNSITLVSG